MVEKISNVMGNLYNKNLCVLGLSFKPETDDTRDAPSLEIIKGLISKGAKIKSFCPQGIKETKLKLENFGDKIEYLYNEYEAAKDSDAIIIVTEWNQFRSMDLYKLKEIMNDKYFFDLRNIYSKDENIRDVFNYFGVGLI